ncbi:hypothetical protein [Cellulomonas xiejunii]|uniref:Uncharacterized protein n=1 Tax=Cellulomonas xiejunii TaxID=2968083 RepID=A0ABY5KMQ2_9CELL|nr:hypothetical protein [Cellulomonas xiejunii]MCC2320741.1 hypothetical protein [Cellulomonas xiejunii]UUI71028.1 hypothetical protein NP048_14685 [Cellulomonas xiejunii]
MQHPGGGPDTADGSQDDLSDLLAPADVQFRPAPPVTRPRRRPAPVPAQPVDTVETALPDLTRHRTPSAPGAPAAPDAPSPDAPPDTTGPPAPPARPDDVVTFGRWFQPVAGGVLPRPDPDEPVVAVIRAAPGSSVHAITAGHARRAPVTLAAGGLELAGDDGTTLVLTAPPDTAWVRDDEDVAAGEVVGVLPTGDGGGGDVELRVLVIGPQGVPRDAVDALVGLPDPGELDLGPGLGTDPFALDLEIAGRADVPGAS